ncbi:MAG TPA: PAS domain-containing protein [Candidatus Sulfotelmatobacter sp.]|nr:PAS domain-containing protein [Candidatus Sulfotelmatobacter sp.]
MPDQVFLTGKERTFPDSEIIVSKTDPQGRITYVNDVFLGVSGYLESEVMGKAHNVIRHPDMPRCVFKLLWDKIQASQEIFAYVNNRAKSGDYYWVLAHITPSFNANRQIIGYHSNRRSPTRAAIAKIAPLYAQLLQEEQKHSDRKLGIEAGTRLLMNTLANQGIGYEEFVFSL